MERQMPRFFIHLKNKTGELIEDEEGSEFAALPEALDEAEMAAREIMSERVAAGRPADGSCFEIANEAGDIVSVLQFEDVLSDNPREIGPRMLRWPEY